MKIELHGLEVHGYHGVLEEERRDGQRFLFDVELDYRDDRSAQTDLLEDAIDYRDAVAIVRELGEGPAFRLLEALAWATARSLRDRLPVSHVRVRVRKPDVELAVPVEHAAVVVELGAAD